MTELVANIGNLAMHVRREGDGPTLLFLHAGIADSRMWLPQLKVFSPDYNVVAPDLRGFGNSRAVDETFSYHRDIVALLDQLGIGQAFVVGCSFGGAVALDLALNHPKRVTGLCLVCSAIAGYEWNGDMPDIAARIDDACEAGDVELCNNLEVQRWVIGEGRKEGDVNANLLELARDMNRIALEMPEVGTEQEPKPDAIHRLNEIDVPTLVIGAEFDDLVSRGRTEILAREIQNAKFSEIKSAGHLPSLERSRIFNSQLTNFLNGTSSL